MSRILGFYPLVTAIITITALICICLFNIYLLARHKNSFITTGIHMVSLFVVFGMIFHMMSAAIFVHSLSDVYRRLSHWSLMIAGFVMVCAGIMALVLGGKHCLKNLHPNIPDALSKIEDVVFVADRDGTITYMNHLDKYHGLFGDIGTLKQLFIFMKEHCGISTDCVKTLYSLSDSVTWELNFHEQNRNGILRITPIVIGVGQLGYTAVLEDISDIRNSEKIMMEQNDCIKQANGKLSEYIKAAGALEAERERLQILEQIQATLIQDIEKALFSIRNIKQYSFQNKTYQTEMKELAAQLRQIYQKVRSTVGQIAGKEVNP